jgi:hypothetical protein
MTKSKREPRQDVLERRARQLGGTFGALIAATPNLAGHERLWLAENLSEERWANGWQRLREQLEGERVLDGVLSLRGQQRSLPRPASTRASRPIRAIRGDDVLDTISPTDYVEALTGEAVPSNGGAIRCVFPHHEDRTPSFYVYRDPGPGWYCHGCHRGGSAIDLAAELTGIEPRGEGYLELRRYIAEKLLVGVAT